MTRPGLRIAAIEPTIVSIPYRHRESSAQVARDGVTDIVLKLTTDDGLVGWGESCSGADVRSILEAVRALEPMVLGRDPWNRSAIWADAHHRGLWNFREGTFAFAYAGIDMALWDICGKSVGHPVYDLLGGLRRRMVDYFCYLPGSGDENELEAACRDGVQRGYGVFYLKVGMDIDIDEARVALVRETIGPDRRIRVDANQAWTVAEATRNVARLDRHGLDFVEQPVAADPVDSMIELRRRSSVPLAANEGLWRVADAWEVISRRAADVLVFSPYWVGSIEHMARLGSAAALQGQAVCKHTHGELGIAAAAGQQVMLTLPRIVDGNQQTASVLIDDVLDERLPIADGPAWDVDLDARPGLGVEIDADKLERWAEHYREVGQYRPWQPELLASEDPGWQLRDH